MSEAKSVIPNIKNDCACNRSISNYDPLQSIVTDKIYDWIIVSSNHNFHLDFEAQDDEL